MDAPYGPPADLLAKIGDDTSRDKGAAALIARAPEAEGGQAPDLVYKALGRLGGPTAVKFLEEKVTAGNKEDALLATRALGERRDPAVLPFALKVAGDPKADKTCATRCSAWSRGSAGWTRRRAWSRSSRRTRTRSSATARSNRCWSRARPTASSRALEAFPASATYKKVDVDDLLVKLIEKQGATAAAGAGQDAGIRGRRSRA